MDVIIKRCAGLDVHKRTVVACVRIVRDGEVLREVRTFGTTTKELLDLFDWLSENDCTHVVMESTGVYWKPVWHILESGFELVLANAKHVRNLPGRKTDVSDAVWLADLLAHGLIRGSFVPPLPIQDLRDLTRTRKQLRQEMSRHVLRIQKILEDANIKLCGVVSDILGVSGRAMLQAIIAGESNPEALVAVTNGRLKASRESLEAAALGTTRDHHRFLLQVHLKQIDELKTAIASIETHIESVVQPFREHLDRLVTIPGVSLIVALVILAEIGVDMSRFSTVQHLLSWAGMCPRSDESAGKHRSTRLKPGDPWLKTILVQAAWAAVKVKDSYLQAQFLRLKARRGPQKAIVAVAASILTAVYYMLRDQTAYVDLTANHFHKRDKHKTADRLVRQLNALGYSVTLQAAA
jgi:transposase